MDHFALLRDQLVNGHFEPGQRLKPSTLASEFGCSASAIREALFRLHTLGLVDFRDQKGFRLPKNSPQLQQELTQMRILLECEGACLSIRLGDLEWEARLTAAHHKLGHIERHVDLGKSDRNTLIMWTTAELEFHRTLIEACGSTLLIQSHDQVYQRIRQQLITADRLFQFVPENVAQHQGIIDAALARDETLVCERITQHLARSLIDPSKAPPSVSQSARRKLWTEGVS
ncbi:GntR family transcriptional regulator [Shimia sp. NS0008-38b]|uniref:GntR family transcriptional regulator n=1 Tax=Shimia sp. NS0008-38b TaxID=3127653 RepID=UPI0031043B25